MEYSEEKYLQLIESSKELQAYERAIQGNPQKARLSIELILYRLSDQKNLPSSAVEFLSKGLRAVLDGKKDPFCIDVPVGKVSLGGDLYDKSQKIEACGMLVAMKIKMGLAQTIDDAVKYAHEEINRKQSDGGLYGWVISKGSVRTYYDKYRTTLPSKEKTSLTNILNGGMLPTLDDL